MLTLFQKGLLAILALGILLIALVVAAKAPAQATTFAPAVQVPVNAVVPPGIVTTGDAIVRVKPDGAVLGVGATAQGSTAAEAQDLLVDGEGTTTATVTFTLLDPKAVQASARAQAIADARTKAEAMAKTANVGLGKIVSVNDIGLAPTVDTTTFSQLVKSAQPAPVAPQLPTGELQVVVRVQVQFELA